MTSLLIFIGGSLGALCRFLLTQKTSKRLIMTWSINLIGSFLLVFSFVLYDNSLLSYHAYQFLTLGFLGSFTTFSAVSLDSLKLIEEKRYLAALSYILAHFIIISLFSASFYFLLLTY